MGEPQPVEFLSSGWLEALSGSLEGVEAEGPHILLGVVVTGVPAGTEGTVSYTIALGGGRPAAVTAGSTAKAEVILVLAVEDALALATGAASVSSLLSAGRVKIRGDAGRLVEAVTTFEAAVGHDGGCHGIVTEMALRPEDERG